MSEIDQEVKEAQWQEHLSQCLQCQNDFDMTELCEIGALLFERAIEI